MDGPSLNEAITHAVAFLTGGGLGYFLMPRKDRHDVKQGNFENTERLIQALEEAYQGYTTALASYDRESPSTTSFTAIATGGERYFAALSLLSSAMLSGLIDKNMRDGMITKRIADAAMRTIPSHYEVLASIAKKRGFAYPDKPERSNYQAIYDATERFGA